MDKFLDRLAVGFIASPFVAAIAALLYAIYYSIDSHQMYMLYTILNMIGSIGLIILIGWALDRVGSTSFRRRKRG